MVMTADIQYFAILGVIGALWVLGIINLYKAYLIRQHRHGQRPIKGIRKFVHQRIWEYGTCRDAPARRSKHDGRVQFILWQAGQTGHTEEYWYEFHSSWWHKFQPTVDFPKD
jgi:hypothetical protein